MYKGDISNDLPKRVLVTTDVFLDVETKRVKRRIKFLSKTTKNLHVRKEVLSYLYLFTVNKGITLELISYELDEESLLSLTAFLDEYGTNPFRYSSAYGSLKQLVNELPYRPEVMGVLDRPDRLLMYGHWGMDMGSL